MCAWGKSLASVSAWCGERQQPSAPLSLTLRGYSEMSLVVLKVRELGVEDQ